MRLLLVLATAALPSLAAAQTYTITVLAPQYTGGTNSFAMSNAGVAVGSGFNTGLPGNFGFLWQNGQTTVVSPLPPGFNASHCWGVNENGDAVGELRVNSGVQGAFRRSAAGAITVLPGFVGGTALGFRKAEDINDLGQVVGYSQLASFTQLRAALWQPDNSITNLGDLPGGWETLGYSITNDGVISGISGVLPVELGTLGGIESRVGWAMNEAGVIVGYSHTGPVGQVDNWPIFHAFRWSEGVMSDLGVYPGHNHSFAPGINNHGDIVGVGIVYNGELEPRNSALLWRNGQIIDLNTRIPPGSGYHLLAANAINDSGWILVEGSQGLFVGSRALLLIPNP
jgi:probable HAF family extracellular repeat protein